ncbi:MAG: DUF2490 domain-containing protein [Bacteroidota bacterium]
MYQFHWRTLFFFVLVICLISGTVLRAQVNDAGLWTSISVETKVVKKVTAVFSQEFRLDEDVTELGTYFTEAGIGYKINKYIQVSANYRFLQKRQIDDSYSTRHRFYLDVKFQKKIKPFQFQFRTRFQDQYADIGRTPDGGIAEYYSRNKFSFKWDSDKRFTPSLSVELFSPLNYPRQYVFDDIRNSVGMEYALSKHHNLDLFYMIQKQLKTSNPLMDYIIGVGYLFQW